MSAESQYEYVVLHGKWSKYEVSGEFHKFEIDLPGRNFPVKAGTKKQETIDAMMAVRDQDATFTLAEKDSTNINPHTDKPYRDRYVSKVEPGHVGEETQRSGGSGGASSSGGESGKTDDYFSPEALARIAEKDRRIVASSAWSYAIELLKPTFRSDEEPDKLFTRVQAMQRRIAEDIGGQWWLDRDPAYLPEALRGDTSSSGTTGTSAPQSEPQQGDVHPDDDIPF